jgi:Tol biopolymer transport system component/DNA-binding winged helix-turn-helix (wHTH) protein
MPTQVREAYAFGDFELDLAARSLTKSGSPVSLAPKTFDLLAMMVRRPGTLLSKREILEELWPNTFVEEANLSFQIANLRKALGENASRWIETVPKHGYRFQASVTPLTTYLPNEESLTLGEPLGIRSQGPPGVATSGGSQWRRVLVATVVAMALLPAGWLIARRFRHSSSALLVALPLNTYRGLEVDPSISPDGNQVAFGWDGQKQDNLDIYVKVIGEEPPLRLTSDPRAECSAAWSPDGRYIAFCREGEVVIMPALGGPERVVARASADWIPDHLQGCVSWFPDGSALAVVGHPVRSGPNGSGYPQGVFAIFGISLTTGHSWQLTFPADRTLGDGGPKISPDGRQLAFLRSNTVDFDQPQLFSVSLTSEKLPSGEPVPRGADTIFGASSGPREWIGTGLAWLWDSRTVIFAQRGRLWSVPVPSGTPTLLPLSGFRPSSLSLSRTGRLVFVNASFDLDILRVPGPMNRNISSKNRSPVPFISSTSPDTNPRYSPDGKRITFTSMRGGGLQIWVCNSDGSNPFQLTHLAVNAGAPRWSPDGRYIAFDSQEAGQGDIYIVSAEGGPVHRFTPEDSHEEFPSWSRDGHWIYFGSNRTGQFQLWKAPFPSGTPVQVTRDWGKDAFESPDGKFVYYAKEDQPGIWRQPVGGGREQLVVDHGGGAFWDMYAHGLCLLNNDSQPPRVECLDFTNHILSTVVTLPDDHRIWRTGPSFAVSPDGQWVLYSHVERADNSIMSVDNLIRYSD